ncbi:MAG: hypothetical protein U1F36_05885 [Planctomycetota bacterium]
MKRALLRLVVIAAAALCCGALLYWRSEAMRTSGRIRLLDRELAEARADAQAKAAQIGVLEQERKARDDRIATLEGQLAQALGQVKEVNDALAARRREIEEERRQFEDRRARAVAPMPEGVRRAVGAFEECLAADGYTGFRLLDARSLPEHGFGDVEMLVAGQEREPSAFWFAHSLRLVLDRAQGVLELRFVGGRVIRNGAVEEIPADGSVLRLTAVDGRTWERRLPTLVEAVGEYPEEGARRASSHALDPWTMDSWRMRLARLLDRAGTELNWDVGRFRDLDQGRFCDASIHGYGKDGLLAQSASVKHLAVEVDRTARIVYLLLEDGVLRKAGGDTTIPAAGYRLLLPGVSPDEAVDAMLGMVVEKR